MFQIGKAVVHPLHGLGYVESIEEKEVLGKRFLFAVIAFENLQVMVNLESQKSPLRLPISEEEVTDLMDYLDACRADLPTNHNQRYRVMFQLLQEGTPKNLCQVLKGLLIFEQSRNLSPRDTKVLERCLSFLSGELSHVLGQSAERVQEELRRRALQAVSEELVQVDKFHS